MQEELQTGSQQASHTVDTQTGQDRGRRNELRLRLALEAAYMISFEWNIQRNEVRRYVSTASALPQTEEAPVTFESVCEVIHPDDRERFISNVYASLEHPEGYYESEHRIISPAGDIVWLYETGHVEFDREGKPLCLIGLSQDITKRKQMEQVLREREDDLNRAQAVGQIGSWRQDVQSNRLAWSDENYRIFGIPQDTPLTYESFLAAVHPDDRGYVDRRWKAGLDGEPYDIEHRIIANGRIKWVREKAYLETDEQGKLLGGFGITQDITQRKLAELALQESNQRKDQFLAMLAHELRNPLAPISNAVQILRMTQADNPALMKTTDLIGRQVSQLTHLVDDLLDVSRISRGKIELKKERIELANIIRQALEASQSQLDSRHHQLQLNLPQQQVRVKGDAARLTQVISNLLNNAAKYTNAGGHITISLTQQPDETSESGHEAIIRVKDNGRGMEPEELAHLFEMFYQVDQTLDRSEGGLGIGLYLVKCLVEMHGGYIEAFSNGRGAGCEFVIHLPCLVAQATPTGGETPAQPVPANAKHILLVEDNPDVADSMVMLLELLGHSVILSGNGKEAVNIALTEKPDIILMDIGLPGLNGYESCRAIREAGLEGAAIVALSGYGQKEDRRKAEAAGFDHHMTKPVDINDLESLLAS